MHDKELATAMAAHRTCWELLPWLINGRLSQQEATLVAKHLASCEECRTELQVQRSLYEEISRKDALVLAPQSSLQKLMARLDAEEVATELPQESATLVAGNETPATPRPVITQRDRPRRWLMFAVAAQGLIIAVLFGALWSQIGDSMTQPRFATLTSEPAVMPHGSAIRVVFANDIEVREVNELLQSIGAQVIAGPGQAGVYTLVLEPGITPDGDVSAVLSSLRADARVVFAEPAVAAGQSP